MRLGVNVPNFGPGTDPGVLRGWAKTVEGLDFDLLMVSDHVVVTDDVAVEYPAPFYEPFTTLSWFAGITDRVRLGTTVLVVPYRDPLLVARMAANLNDLSGGRFVLGVGVGWAKQEFAQLGVPFERRGQLTDEYLGRIRSAWAKADDYRAGHIPIWVGGNSEAAIRRTKAFGDVWHPLHCTVDWLGSAVERTKPEALAPRIALRLTEESVTGTERIAGEGTIDQVIDDLRQISSFGAETVLLDTYTGDPADTRDPEKAWQALATVVAKWKEAQ
ncbi:LLM class flavin-dependent oxidoreductase [Amycolatopsis sp. NPDC059657]|uniref:LLM class flavin-dependent oxidoreductase n=1 Tax=Amycolatopsis sp. NPDC059657 TaxID=3346899 RepID=UPI00366CE0AC